MTGEDFLIDGAQLKAQYSDGTYELVDVTDEMLEAIPDMTVAGNKTVQILYYGWEYINDLTFDILVKDPSVVKVEMDPEPTKKVYIVGDEFDPAGGKIKITFDDGEIIYIDITEEMCGGFDMNVPGTYKVCVNYGDEKFYYEITVNDVAEPDDEPPADDTPDVEPPVDNPPVDNPPSGDISLVAPITVLLISGMGVCITFYLKKRNG